MPKKTIQKSESFGEKLKRAETVAIGSPMVVRIVGSILVAALVWIGGKVTNNNDAQIKIGADLVSLTTNFGKLENRVDASIKDQYTKADAAKDYTTLNDRIRDTSAKIDAAEIRIKLLEDKMSKLGGPSDPTTALLELMKNQIVTLQQEVTAMRKDLTNLLNKKGP